jgi:hypothetical protein
MSHYDTLTVPGEVESDTLTENSRVGGTVVCERIVPVRKSRRVLARERETDRWVAELVKMTLERKEGTGMAEKAGKGKSGAVDVKRHRMVSTKCAVGVRRRSVVPRPRVRSSVARAGDAVQDPISSWIASEIFTIAAMQALESTEADAKAEDGDTCVEGGSDVAYEDIESLIGDYLEDVKVTGSDCEEAGE